MKTAIGDLANASGFRGGTAPPSFLRDLAFAGACRSGRLRKSQRHHRLLLHRQSRTTPRRKCSTICSAIFPNLIKSYPSSNPLMSQQHLAAVLHVNPDHLIIGNGATELIALINTTLIDRIARAHSHLRRVHRKAERPARRGALSRSIPNQRYELRLDDYLALGAQAQSEGAAGDQSRQSHRPVHPARRDDRFPARRARIWSS